MTKVEEVIAELGRILDCTEALDEILEVLTKKGEESDNEHTPRIVCNILSSGLLKDRWYLQLRVKNLIKEIKEAKSDD